MRFALLAGAVLLASCGSPETEIGSDGGGLVFRGDAAERERSEMEQAGFRAGFDDYAAARTLGPELAFRRAEGREPEGPAYDAFLEGYERGFSAGRGR